MLKQHLVSKKAVACGAVAAAMTCAVAFALTAGTAPQVAGADDTTQADATYEEWISTYPDQYGTFVTDNWRDGGGGYKTEGQYDHAHYRLRQNIEDMFETTAPGYMKVSCLSCKTTAINDLYEKYGDAVFQEEPGLTMDILNNEIEAMWDCETCHTSIDDLTVRPGIFTWDELSEGEFDDQAPQTLACAQCHNAWGNIVKFSIAGTGKGIEEFHPYQYGHDPDALYKEFAEDGSTRVQFEEETGLVVVNTTTYDIEHFAGSVHEELGMTCASCHMPKMKNGNGETFTSHNASSSPLANVTTLETCMPCHQNDEVQTTDDMVAFVRAAQDEFGQNKAEVDAMLDGLETKLREVIADGSVDADVLDQARDLYNRATYYLSYAASYVHGRDGVKIAHNPTGMTQYVEDARAMAEEARELLGIA